MGSIFERSKELLRGGAEPMKITLRIVQDLGGNDQVEIESLDPRQALLGGGVILLHPPSPALMMMGDTVDPARQPEALSISTALLGAAGPHIAVGLFIGGHSRRCIWEEIEHRADQILDDASRQVTLALDQLK